MPLLPRFVLYNSKFSGMHFPLANESQSSSGLAPVQDQSLCTNAHWIIRPPVMRQRHGYATYLVLSFLVKQQMGNTPGLRGVCVCVYVCV